MLCEKCGQREATAYLVLIVDGRTDKSHLCTECCDNARSTLHLPTPAFHERVGEIVMRDQRYRVEAYEFVQEAVAAALKLKSAGDTVSTRHVSAGEVLEVIRTIAQLRFGKEARRTLNGWGIRTCEDFGEIIFNLVDAGLLGKLPTDRKEDFQGGYNFDEAFPEN